MNKRVTVLNIYIFKQVNRCIKLSIRVNDLCSVQPLMHFFSLLYYNGLIIYVFLIQNAIYTVF